MVIMWLIYAIDELPETADKAAITHRADLIYGHFAGLNHPRSADVPESR